MDTIEFMSVLDEIIDILSSCESTINADSDECFVCSNDIKENESDATCECCSKQFHVTCMGFPCEDKLSNLKLIWICSFCGNSNIAHRMFDKVCIPSHFNRYELLVDQGDEECITDMPNQSTKKRDGRKCTRSKKRYAKRGKKSCMLPEKRCIDDMEMNQGFANVQSSCWWQEKRTRSSRGFLICNGHSVVLRTQSWQVNFFNRLQSTTLQSSLLEP
ncbi:uncharacterized protein LOC129284048 isoform X4 [Lytechinus pictus]|uniref:uncharacterized protein LOC129284048 isoform X4 n=2 Tax=Lytechinus pictus TaxID=7653 RepID=UPI0030B9B4CD